MYPQVNPLSVGRTKKSPAERAGLGKGYVYLVFREYWSDVAHTRPHCRKGKKEAPPGGAGLGEGVERYPINRSVAPPEGVDEPWLTSDRERHHIARAAFRALPPPPQLDDRSPWLVLRDEFVDRPPVLVVASPAAGADRRHLAVLLERGKGHVPSLAGFLIHGGIMAPGRRERKAPPVGDGAREGYT